MVQKNGAKPDILKKREEGFNLSISNDRLEKYSALGDQNLRHFFENRKLQKQLLATGLIDRSGRVIDLDRNMSKLFIIEQEFKQAEKSEYLRQKEEEDLRYRVQQKRRQALEDARREEKLRKMKEDRRVKIEIMMAAKHYVCPDLTSKTESPGSSTKKRSQSKKEATF